MFQLYCSVSSFQIMDDLDAALNELGMLSSISEYKIDYLQAIETSAEIKRARSVSMPDTRREESESENVNISINTNFVANISLGQKAPDLSPYVKRKLQREIEEKRFNDNNSNTHIW